MILNNVSKARLAQHQRQRQGTGALQQRSTGVALRKERWGSWGTWPERPQRRQHAVRARADEEEPDWDKEMSIFKQRTMRPNQLATLRELESKVNLGRVLWCDDSLAIMAGINPDAPIGTKLAFVSGGSGILLWHRSDNLAFAIIAGGSVQPGEGVECKLRGILQVLDDTAGPITRKEYELMQAPAGDSLFGAVVNYIGQPIGAIHTPANAAHLAAHAAALAAAAAAAAASAGSNAASSGSSGSSGSTAAGAAPMVTTSWDEEGGGPDVAGSGVSAVGLERLRPLINQQVAMKNREQITESLFTGVKALDTLTPLGRGASLLIIGPSGAGKTSLALDALQGAAVGAGVRCVLASTTTPAAELEAQLKELEAAGCLSSTAVFFAEPDAPLGTKLATLMAAAAAGERVRDEGGHALVVLDDISPLSNTWDRLVLSLADLGQEKLREGLIKDEAGHDVGALAPRSQQELVDYEGMLVSGAVAQRRGFFSILFLRAAKLHAAFGGGSMTLLPLVPGRPASGTKALLLRTTSAAPGTKEGGGGQAGEGGGGQAGGLDLSRYKTLSEEQKARLAEVLEKRQAAEAALLAVSVGPGELKTETVEEFISISDGQVVLEPPMSLPSSSSSSQQQDPQQDPQQRDQQQQQQEQQPSARQQQEPQQQQQQQAPPPPWRRPYSINPRLSITRVGSRAYYKALADLAPQVRLDLAQAEDARKFATNRDDPVLRRFEAHSQRLAAALAQAPGSPVPLEELVVVLYAVQSGLTDGVGASQLQPLLEGGLDWLRQHNPQVLTSIASSKQLTAAAEKGVREAFAAVLQRQQQQALQQQQEQP